MANKEFLIESIWATESSFSATTPVHLLKDEWQPSANLDLDVQTAEVDGKRVVNLLINVAVSIKDKEIFKLKSVHTGVFNVTGYDDKELEQITESFCPSIIYPYAREKVSAMVSSAGFPPLHLSPVDFDARYRAAKEGKA
ncbi:protein-export chaperone SecB [Candidatus Synchoanobacter obligatus]|uniref:Protein-export chaperone SecB n=1 Tax=Candidatus Synchoanobacter obligatus TaxID=2919597 RepID=A0ABT1L415_9GAMM|nr:protein-export chaperone SecB [Candidatus Synchoanobacter obligatus]MCP8351691.1 protein-export chaperone SecB [Candidatus Synchoanobacter obligatus]